MIRLRRAWGCRDNVIEPVATTSLALDVSQLGHISIGGQVPASRIGAVAGTAVWFSGTALSSLIPAVTLHVAKGYLNPTEGLTLVGVQFVLVACFTLRAARCAHEPRWKESRQDGP
jgi:hypothetical protein